MVAPRAAAPARRSASVSAWGRPPGWVQPRPTIIPSLAITAPTAGLAQVRPSPRRPSASASAMKRASCALVRPASLNAFNSDFFPGIRFTLYQGAATTRSFNADQRERKARAYARRRVIYIGAEQVGDVTRHPAFRNAARTIADLYDFKADPDRRDLFSFEENGERYGLPWLRCRTREDLVRRMRAMKATADATYGLIGRSPDHVAGLITGPAMKPTLLDALTPGFGDNLIRYYEHARKNDLYVAFAVTPPAGIRSREIFTGEARDDPTLQVVAEGDDGVTISGMKMLATGAVFADEVWIGNLTPIDDKRESESITCALPVNTPGVSFWAREPYERHARHEADYPLSFRFDETDTVLVCDRVKVPWERVFLHNNGAMSRRIYIETPANCYQNDQSNVRFWAKMGLIVGLASRMCQANGVDKIPAVREILGRLAALEATIGGLVNG